MKVLLLYSELLDSFWTMSQLCELGGYKALCPPLGLLTVNGLLPRTWDLRLVDLNARQLAQADWNWADMVMISGMLLQRQGLRPLIQEGKQQGKMVVVGGPYPTPLTEEVWDMGCDFLIKGEAENTM